METAKLEKPHIHRGTYYSLPEWSGMTTDNSHCIFLTRIHRFNPYYAKYGYETLPGGLARNPYDPSQFEPYTGMLNITDYLDDLLLPQMVSLAVDYGTEIMVRIQST